MFCMHCILKKYIGQYEIPETIEVRLDCKDSVCFLVFYPFFFSFFLFFFLSCLLCTQFVFFVFISMCCLPVLWYISILNSLFSVIVNAFFPRSCELDWKFVGKKVMSSLVKNLETVLTN